MNDTVNGVVRQTTEVSTVNLRRYSCRPGGGPPSHIQTREKEAFYILEGQLTFYGQGAEIAAGSGTYCDIQKGTQHRFRNNTERTAKMLLFSAPAGIEGLFDEVFSVE